MVLACLQLHSNVILKHVSVPSEEFTVLYCTVYHVPEDTSATAGLEMQKDNVLCLSLKKKAKEAIQVQAAEEAVLEVDAEVSASQQQLQDLVQLEATKVADKRINALKQELAAIKKLITAINTGRGHTSNGASKKKKEKKGWKPPKRPKRSRWRSGVHSPKRRQRHVDHCQWQQQSLTQPET
jgi:hypothetical protein